MASDLDGLPDQEVQLCEVLAAYFEAVKAGQAPDRAAWLADHPEIADELAAFLEQQDCLLHITEPLRTIIEGAVGVPRPEPIEGTAGSPAGIAPQTDSADHDAAHPVVQVFGDYELIGEPTYGGMSVVYRAVQRSLNRPVALKMLRGGTLAERDDIRRFRLEAEAIANLDHPNIVPIYEVGVHDGLCYFAMKLIEGGSLAQRLAESRPDPKVGRKPDGHGRPRRPPCTPARHSAPRLEALEHRDRCRWTAACHRLRPGQAGGRQFRADAVGRDPGDAILHGPRAGVRARTGRSRRQLTFMAWAPSSTPS